MANNLETNSLQNQNLIVLKSTNRYCTLNKLKGERNYMGNREYEN